MRLKSSSSRASYKKGNWTVKTLVAIVLVGGCIYFVKEARTAYSNMSRPVEKVVYSQDEALKRLQGLLPSWRGDHRQLPGMFANRDQEFAWLETEDAKESASWLLAMELDRYGYTKESQPYIVEMQLKNVRNLDSYDAEQASQILDSVMDWALRLEARGATDDAEKLNDAIIAVDVRKAGKNYLTALEHSIKMKINRSDVSAATPLLENYRREEVQKALQTPEQVRAAAEFLLLEDSIKSSLSKEKVTSGQEIAKALLEQHQLQNSPEMGRILLVGLSEDLKKEELTGVRAEEMAQQLEKALQCFKAADPQNMAYVPEIMLALAKLYYSAGNPETGLLWIDRAEGVTMTLGVTEPRLFPGNSLEQDIRALRKSCTSMQEEVKATASLRSHLKETDKLIDEKNYAQARKVAEQNLEDAKKKTAFVDGYIPVIRYQIIKSLRRDKMFERTAGELESLINSMKSLSSADLNKVQDAVVFFGLPKDFYKSLHRELASIYLRQKKITRAKEVMKDIGETISSIDPAE